MWSSPPDKVGRPEKETLQGAGVGRGPVTCGWMAWQERPLGGRSAGRQEAAEGQGAEPSGPPAPALYSPQPSLRGGGGGQWKGSLGLPPRSRPIGPPRSLELLSTFAPRAATCFLVSDCKQI